MEQMRTRRRTRKRRYIRGGARGSGRRTRGSARGGGGVGSALFALLMIGLAAYALLSDGAAEWLDENIVVPVYALLSPKSEVEDNNEGDVSAPVSASSDITVGTGALKPLATGEVSLPSLSCYMLQMGAYSSKENALAGAEAIKERGAAGFIIEDETAEGVRYRVIAAGYLDEESARDVRERLTSEGIDSALYQTSSAEATFRVTANDDTLQGVGEGFASFAPLTEALAEASIAIDRDSLSVTEGKSLLSAARDAFSLGTSTLTAYSEESELLSSISAVCGNIIGALDALISNEYESDIAFSAQVKYNYLYTVSQYNELIKILSE